MTMVLTGIGGCLPPQVVTNEDISPSLQAKPEWIRRMTGIAQRRMVSGGLSTRDLAIVAGRRALASAGHPRIDAVLVTTCSPDRITPAVAPEVAATLGLGNVMAFDLNSGCSGFVYGLATASGLLAAGVARHVLLIAAEAFTPLVNPADRITRPIFGDGAGAIVVRSGVAGEPGAFGPIDVGSDGERADLLSIAAGGSRQRAACGLGHGMLAAEDWYLKMDGRAVYERAVAGMSASTRTALARAGWNVGDVDWFVAHQANARILRTVGFELGLAEHRIAVNIDRIGNTLTASIPLLLNELALDGRLVPSQRVLVSAFGAGLSWGSVSLQWPPLAIESAEWDGA